MFDQKTALQPVHQDRDKPSRYWMRFVRNHFVRPADSLPPRGMALPERLWQRQSALITSMQESNRDD
ncbi:MAG: hypothetical protein N0E59_19980 [Candidatus Thiodiazotropha taylori]|nr:hypothetical protein [Shewanella sp.]MCG7924471.1 hypothetical protein [Candidatus Thiodiazotropha taylori]MCG7965899.1 hypothetical protein [Candidatus Thiodiazotropha taylori]MCG7997609.1 hypothetical protein [Candidatus Thiodiazotropha taylori]MCG8051082.1 hypothetical protein [Candidatus Thiodiazotropha taylori]